MTQEFRRTGELKSLGSYPQWLQEVAANTNPYKRRVVEHEFFALLRDARLPTPAMRKFMVGAWPTIEQFPQFMSLNLMKLSAGESRGEDLARDYLTQNIRVEKKHAQHWVEWARVVGLELDDLRHGEAIEGLASLAHWCWYVCQRRPLPVAIAATNYAVEGVTGEWSCLVCSKDTYAHSLPEKSRASAMRWLRLHAEYDDTHPWQALEIVATLMGCNPPLELVKEVERAIRSSYVYFETGLDHAMAVLLHGTFEETASNASTLGALDAA
jgi:pyrroloquinoline quinone (PQQ) biosynthesis protein C